MFHFARVCFPDRAAAGGDKSITVKSRELAYHMPKHGLPAPDVWTPVRSDIGRKMWLKPQRPGERWRKCYVEALGPTAASVVQTKFMGNKRARLPKVPFSPGSPLTATPARVEALHEKNAANKSQKAAALEGQQARRSAASAVMVGKENTEPCLSNEEDVDDVSPPTPQQSKASRECQRRVLFSSKKGKSKAPVSRAFLSSGDDSDDESDSGLREAMLENRIETMSKTLKRRAEPVSKAAASNTRGSPSNLQPNASRGPVPSTSRNPGLSTCRGPGPSTSRDPGPSTSRDPGPSTLRNPGASTSMQQCPASSRSEGPRTGLQLKIAADKEGNESEKPSSHTAGKKRKSCELSPDAQEFLRTHFLGDPPAQKRRVENHGYSPKPVKEQSVCIEDFRVLISSLFKSEMVAIASKMDEQFHDLKENVGSVWACINEMKSKPKEACVVPRATTSITFPDAVVRAARQRARVGERAKRLAEYLWPNLHLMSLDGAGNMQAVVGESIDAICDQLVKLESSSPVCKHGITIDYAWTRRTLGKAFYDARRYRKKRELAAAGNEDEEEDMSDHDSSAEESDSSLPPVHENADYGNQQGDVNEGVEEDVNEGGNGDLNEGVQEVQGDEHPPPNPIIEDPPILVSDSNSEDVPYAPVDWENLQVDADIPEGTCIACKDKSANVKLTCGCQVLCASCVEDMSEIKLCPWCRERIVAPEEWFLEDV